MRIKLIGLILIAPGFLFADVAAEFNQDASWVQQENTTYVNGTQNFDPTSLPGYSPDAPQEAYYNSPDPDTAVKTAASQAAATDPNAQALTSEAESGPQFTINPNAPDIQHATTAEADSYDIVNGIPDKYNNNCQPTQTCTTTSTDKTCIVSHSFKAQCTNTLQVSVNYQPYPFDCNHLVSTPGSVFGYSYTEAPGPDSSGMCVTGFYTYYNYPWSHGSPSFPVVFQQQGDINVTLPPNVQATVYMLLTGVQYGPNPFTDSFGIRSSNGIPSLSVAVSSNGRNDLTEISSSTQGSFTTPNTGNIVPMSYHYNLSKNGADLVGFVPALIYIKYPYTAFSVPVESTSWVNSCPGLSGNNQCTLQKQTCTDSSNPKVINGQSITEPCWAYSQNYTCGTDSNSCSPQDISNCDQINSVCSSPSGNYCLAYQDTYSCPVQQCVNQGMECGGNYFCVNGDCTPQAPTQNPNFGKDDAELSAVTGALQGLTGSESATVFTGQAEDCSETAIGFYNCCANSGWGINTGLASCSNEEKALGQDRENSLTYFVGKYCYKSVLGVCVDTHEMYCTWGHGEKTPSIGDLLAYDVQTQGRLTQLGRNFGTGESPDCSGLSVADIQKINFNDIDFSNLINQVESQATLPNPSQVQQAIQQKIQQQWGNS